MLFYSRFYDQEGHQKAKNEIRRILPAGRLPRTTVRGVMNLGQWEEMQGDGKGSTFLELLSSNTAPVSVSSWDTPWRCSLNLPADDTRKAFLTKDTKRVKNTPLSTIWFFQVPGY